METHTMETNNNGTKHFFCYVMCYVFITFRRSNGSLQSHFKVILPPPVAFSLSSKNTDVYAESTGIHKLK